MSDGTTVHVTWAPIDVPAPAVNSHSSCLSTSALQLWKFMDW